MVHGGNGAGPGPLAGPAGKIKWEKRAAVRPPAAFVRGEIPAHGPCAVASGPVWCAPLPAPVQGRGPDPPGLLGRLPSLIRHSICRPAQGAEERGAVVRPEPAAGRAVWGSTPGGAEGTHRPCIFSKILLSSMERLGTERGRNRMEQLRITDTPAGPISYLLTRKRVKNLNLRVRNGQVSLSMPLGCPAEEADAMVRAKCRWIIQALERQWAPGPELPPEPARQECLRLLGRRWIGSILWCSPLGWPGRS